MRAQDLADALEAKRLTRGWLAKCPAHDDTRESLSIGEKDNGEPLIHCFAGCRFVDIVDALRSQGLWSDPTREQKDMSRQRHNQREIEHARTVVTLASYDYKHGGLASSDHGAVAKAIRVLESQHEQ